MGQGRRLDAGRRIVGDRRFGNTRIGYNGPERRSTFDRRSYNDRRYSKHTPSKIDLFQRAS
jgi:hypothetical protein